MAYFIGYILTTAVAKSNEWYLRALISLHPTGAFTIGLNAFVEYEDASLGITFDTWQVTSEPHGFTFKDTCMMLYIDIVFWVFMAWYCDNVIPSEWGTQQPPWFFLVPSYWVPSLRNKNLKLAEQLVDSEKQEDDAIEPVGAELLEQIANGNGIQIKNLRKSFNTSAGVKHAVDGLDLNMYNNQITCLLGHNGAGKSTTIAMLTGLMSPSGGEAHIMGKNVAEDMREIRKDLGVCPQHDILFPDLTVREHLQLFATFKGVESQGMRDEIDKMISEVGLVEKADTKSSQLSGGMKRKLSVGIAFIGGSKTVLLDEPTSGMDPYSRRFTWNVIRNMRENRTIILTTHFMDEADLLG
jgi:ATP-binding cassette subfamily A (ABC1) protein 3